MQLKYSTGHWKSSCPAVFWVTSGYRKKVKPTANVLTLTNTITQEHNAQNIQH